jgi:hypothetical protein
MRRCFAILLLVLLPLQFSWAAVAGSCGQESDSQAQQLGHYEHMHASQIGVENDSDSGGKDVQAPVDFECGHCHGSCCSLLAALAGLTVLPIVSHPATPGEGIVRSLVQNPPERPQWLRFA